jgi:hypothetical protein
MISQAYNSETKTTKKMDMSSSKSKERVASRNDIKKNMKEREDRLADNKRKREEMKKQIEKNKLMNKSDRETKMEKNLRENKKTVTSPKLEKKKIKRDSVISMDNSINNKDMFTEQEKEGKVAEKFTDEENNLFRNFSCENINLSEMEEPKESIEERSNKEIEQEEMMTNDKMKLDKEEMTVEMNLNENMNIKMNDMEELMNENIELFSELEVETATKRVEELSQMQESLDDMVNSSNRILIEINKKVISNVYEEMDSNLYSWQMVMDFLRMEKEGLFMDSKIKALKDSWFMDKDEEFEEYIKKSDSNNQEKKKLRCRERFHEKEHICSECKNEREKKKITFLNLMLSNTNVRKWSLENNCQVSLNLNLLKVKAEEFNLDDHKKKVVIYNKSENSKLVEIEMSMKKRKNYREELPSSYFDFSIGSMTSIHSLIFEKTVKVSLTSKYLVTAMRSMHQERPVFFDMSCVNAIEVREKDKNCFYRMMKSIMPEVMSESKAINLFEVSCMSDLPMDIEMLLLTNLKRRNLYISIKKENSLLNHISTEDFHGAHKIKGYLLSTLELRSIKFYRMRSLRVSNESRNWNLRISDESLERSLVPVKSNCFYEMIKVVLPEIEFSNRYPIFIEMHCMFDIPGDVMNMFTIRGENLKVYYRVYSNDDKRNHISLMPFDGSSEIPLLNLLDEGFYRVKFYEDVVEKDSKESVLNLIKNKKVRVDEFMKDLVENNTRSSSFSLLFINYFRYNNMDRDSIMDIINRLKKFYKHTFITLEDFKIWVNLNNNIDETDVMMMENNILFLMYDIMQVVEISKNMVEINSTSLTAEEVIKIKRRRSFNVEETKKLYRLHNYLNRRINPEDEASEWSDMIFEFIINSNSALKSNTMAEDTMTINKMKVERSNSKFNTESGKEFEHDDFEEDWVEI